MSLFQKRHGSFYLDDMVIIRKADDPMEPCELTINCPDKTGLACDLCRIIFLFGLYVVRADLSTDGKWCFMVFWVVGKSETRWELLKKRLLGACPLVPGIQSYWFGQMEVEPRQPQVFLLKFWCHDRLGLLHDITRVLCELELTIKKVKVSTTPDGKVMHLFFITDTREVLHTKERRQDTCDHLKAALGDFVTECEIEIANAEMTTSLQALSALPLALTEELHLRADEGPFEPPPSSLKSVSVAIDNSLSPSHTLIQILSHDQKGVLYDIMRVLKDQNIQLSYARLYTDKRGNCEMDLFVTQTDGKKIVDATKQEMLRSHLRMELFQPLHVMLVNRGPDVELLVANPVELSGKGRPLVLHDITLALKTLNALIFMVTVRRHVIGNREWEVYRILLDDCSKSYATRKAIKDGVTRKLMGWDLGLMRASRFNVKD